MLERVRVGKAFPKFLGTGMMFQLIEGESCMNFTCDVADSEWGCLTRRGCVQWTLFSSLPKTKRAAAITKGTVPAK